uniref:Uncharacterized protein n=1 Tax=Daphnia galeata TaxID=27404 RepID=A0A8J2WA13_9CRUS|nr:unnamed protein product [Daphnia galeata]
MEGVTCSWSVPRWILVSLFLIAWIHLTTGHGKKRAGGTFTTTNLVPLSSRILHSLPVDGVSSEELIEASAVEPGGHSVINTRDVIKRNLPPRFIINMLKSRLKGD